MRNLLRSVIKALGYEVHRLGLPPYGANAMADILRYSPKPLNTLIDVGANIGQTCEEFHRYFPNETIHAFEPVSTTYQRLAENTRHFRNVTTHATALGSHRGTATIWLQPNDQTNSLNAELNVQTEKSEVIKITTLDAFALENGIQEIGLLKSDTENFDLDVIEGASGLLREGRIGFVLSEVGIAKADTGHTNLFDLSERLIPDNFELMGLYDRLYHYQRPRVRSWCNALFIRRDLLD